MAPDLTRTSSKRKRPTKGLTHDEESPKKQLRASLVTETRPLIDATNALDETRRTLLRLFNAIEATLLSSLSLSNFHSIQAAVQATARCDFEMPHLGQILGVWPDVYRIESSTALVRNSPVGTLAISFPEDALHAASASNRRTEFEKRLGSWTGQAAQLPLLQVHAHIPINKNKIEMMRRPTQPIPPIKQSSVGASTALRKDALLERVRLKAQQKASLPSGAEIKDATIIAMIPNAVQSIKILLASRRQKAIGMRELSDNLCTSLNDRMAREDVERLIEELARTPQYAAWCKVGLVGDVKIVRFIGLAPMAQGN